MTRYAGGRHGFGDDFGCCMMLLVAIGLIMSLVSILVRHPGLKPPAGCDCGEGCPCERSCPCGQHRANFFDASEPLAGASGLYDVVNY